jgi:anti-anti-sigma factor
MSRRPVLATQGALTPLAPTSARKPPSEPTSARSAPDAATCAGTPPRAVPGLSAEIIRIGGTVAVVLYGELDASTAPVLRTLLAQLRDSEPARLTFELAGLSFTDCAGARAIAGLGNRPPAAGSPAAGPRIIRHARPAVRRVFELLGLDAVWLIDPD